MPLFRSNASNERYSQVAGAEYESKPFNDEEYSPRGSSSDRELLALTQSLQRTNKLLKIMMGLCAGVFVVFFLATADSWFRVYWARTRQLIPTPVPPLEDTKVVFRKDPVYASRPNDESEKAWNALLPPGRGFVFIPDHDKYDLPLGEQTPYGMIYSIALFHQLHCLGQIRSYTWQLLRSIENNDTLLQQGMVKMLVEQDGGDHLNHCYDYLRQTIQCAGDMAVEWPRTEPDGRRFAVDGWDIPHVCKSWDGIMDYMEHNYFNASMNDQIAPH